MAHRAVELAEGYSFVHQRARGINLRYRFRENTKILGGAYFSFSEAAKNKEVLTAGAEWLLDNYHVIDEQVQDIARDLPRSYYKALPKLSFGEWKGYPRVYQLVCDYLSHTDATVDTELLSVFVSSFQSRAQLKIGEIWAVPIMLRLALVENLRRLAQMSLHAREQRLIAESFCQETIDPPKLAGAEMLIGVVNRINAEPDLLDFGAAHILRRLRARGTPAALTLQWFDEKVRERGVDPNELARREQQSQAADQISVGNSVTALKSVGSLNWRDWFEQVSIVDHVLSRDEADLYSRCDFITRDLYRHEIEKLSRRSKRSEVEVAHEVVALAAEKAASSPRGDPRFHHVGYYLIDEGNLELEARLGLTPGIVIGAERALRRGVFLLYFGALLAVVGLGMSLIWDYGVLHGGGTVWLLLSLFLFAVPLSEWSILIVQWFVTRLVSPKPLPKYDLDEGIPDEFKTLVAIQAIFNSRQGIERSIEALEIRALGNEDQNLLLAVVADLADSDHPISSGDRGLMRHAEALIKDLNRRYCDGGSDRFFLFFRKRLYNEREGAYMGWERKRGKIMELNRLLRGAEDTTFTQVVGDREQLKNVRYVITLDGDTQLPPGSARKLIATIAHPLNRPIFDEEKRVVRRGYGIIQPRVGIALQSGNASLFARIFSGHSGLDPYTRTVSDVYQDLFGEGSYIGKGIYDVDAFERALDDRVPENALLSHDLFEGLFARVGLASDIELFDEFPARYHAHARRQHRWIRGDWQLAPWLGRTVPDSEGRRYLSPISLLGQWKLLDNLRRSLVSPTLFAGLLAIWTVAPGSQLTWLIGFLIVVGYPVYSTVINALLDPPLGYSVSNYARSFWFDLRKQTVQVVLQLVLIPHQAFLALHAILVTLYRVCIGKQHLLEWETADAAERRLTGELKSFASSMFPALGLTVPACAAVAVMRPETAPWALPFLLAWVLSPVLAWRISQPTERGKPGLDPESRDYLRDVAYSTWRYFDTYLRPEYNHLIPDNLQVIPRRVVAERTSPTNISLSILSVISAYDLGFIPLSGVIDRVSNTLATLKRLERFHGHFLNWYEIRTLRPLPPRYVSTVDSGNLVGHFVAARQAFLSFPHAPLLIPEHIGHVLTLLRNKTNLSGGATAALRIAQRETPSLQNFVHILENLEVIRNDLEASASSGQTLRTVEEILALRELVGWVRHLPLLSSLGERGVLHKRLRNVTRILTGRTPTLSLILKVTNRLRKLKDLVNRADISVVEADELQAFQAAVTHANDKVVHILSQGAQAALDLQKLADEVDFRFLFDKQKKLLVIGYNVENGRRDASYYDLLASEARLGSFVAVARGELPQTHWFVLNRALTDTPGGKALLSWSATMFEYLMPLLVMRDFPNTLLSETYRTVVKTQRYYARRRGVPWGISESAYSGVDFEKTYQYRAFGIPGLGLKRGLAEDVVVSPYSTALALPIDPQSAVRNLRRLEAEGVRGEFGFYEAADYTKERLAAEETRHVVKSFLAHHQGMSLVSINNYLNNWVFPRRFHSSPVIRASELLLQERFPKKIPIIVPHQAELSYRTLAGSEAQAERGETIRTPHTTYPRVRLLSNGRYLVIVDNAGSGASFYQSETALTRWREDGVTNGIGSYFYVRDLKTKKFWSTTYQPTKIEPEEFEVLFNPDKVEFRRRDFGLSCNTQITVSPEDDVEVRQITLTNTLSRRREIELTSYGEVVLASSRADSAHPAFSKMFVQSEFLEEFDALLFTRRPRSEKERPLWFVHMLTMPVVWAPLEYESSRSGFLGRGGTLASPQVMRTQVPLSGQVGTVLDPIYSLRARVELEPGDSQSMTFVNAVAETREQAIELARRYHEAQPIVRAFEMAWSHSDVELRHQQFSIKQGQAFQLLANAVLYNIDALRAPPDVLKKSKLSQSALWRLGISGDEPIVLVSLNDPDQTKLAQEALLAHEYLRLRGLRFDLVLLNEYPGGYLQNLQEELDLLIRTGFSRDFVDRRGGVFLRNVNQISEDEAVLLFSSARVVLYGNRGNLGSQLSFGQKVEPLIQRKRQRRKKEAGTFKPPREPLLFPTRFGGFSDDGHAYTITVNADNLPPQPWSNVVANRDFGFLITESGAGYTWAENSRENRLSPWSNDPVCDPLSEVVYVRDQENGTYWCPTPRPVNHGELVRVKHSYGYSEFSTQVNQIYSRLTISGSTSDRVKWWHVELVNGDVNVRKLEMFLYFEWVLGVLREEAYRHIRSGFDSDSQILYAINPYNNEFGGQVAFCGSSQVVHSFTSSRREFLGRHGDVSSPGALEQPNLPASLGTLFAGPRATPVRLSGAVGGGFDPCAALKVQLSLNPGERQYVLFYVAQAPNLQQAKAVSQRYKTLRHWSNAIEQVKRHWSSITSSIQVRTPDRKFDVLVNGWLLYQTLSCRILARTGFYQCSGALGFRDQLQDCLALLFSRPDEVRTQILLHASRQFLEGDVQHWWHPPSGRGIRTRISDNYLWLPYAVERYLSVTGDHSILDERVKFLEAPLLGQDEHELYLTPKVSNNDGTLFEHCTLALERAKTSGVHGLPLMGAGDWNDGLNAVGLAGRGESVWLAWFTADVLIRFATVCDRRGETGRGREYRERAERYVQAVESGAWDGKWYRRAYFDDGTPIGSDSNEECRIDSIAQSWSVITGLGQKERARQAVHEACDRLVKQEDGIIQLLTPPFDRSKPSPGYIQGYPPGLRENGGQYTHAAAWLILATARLGEGGKASQLFGLINPISRTSGDAELSRYQTEPYVTCGDVYSVPPYAGRGGWSWYTGSSGWLYRVAIEEILGLKVFADRIEVDPRIPAQWEGFSIEYTRAATTYRIQVLNPSHVEHGVKSLEVDGAICENGFIPVRSGEGQLIVNVVVILG